ncbi:membrane protein [Geobacillus genomosp. 3]|uniref:Membrane protein n=1 Tax=Geobacillus genomosp. 3 TaxID=1921421 RepID=S5ZCU2_GEOG3|nr:PH domain-containing protein [Geobacillus genomosp. 3]AGT32025.1 membrane protein [Geobacillus genomosp. 3]
MMSKRRLHPVAILSGVGKELKNMIVPLLVIIAAGSRNRFSWRDFIVPLAAVVYTVVMGVLSWIRFTYAWDEDRLLVEEGVFVRKRRSIPLERIHGMSVTEGVWQRMAGVVQVHIEAAGHVLGEAEVMLRAISREEARQLQRCVEQAKRKAETIDHPASNANRCPPPALFTLSMKEVWIVSLTSGGTLGVVVALGAFLSQLVDFIPYEALVRDIQSTWNGHSRWFLGGFVFVVLFAAYGVAIVQNMVRYASFAVRKQEDTIVITRGWLERKSVSIPVARVQGVVIHENWLRRLFGYASVSLIHAGGGLDGGEAGDVVLCPLIKKNRVASIMQTCLSEYDPTVAFHPLPKRAKSRYMLRPLCWLVIPAVLAAYVERPWGVMAFLLLPFGAWIGACRFHLAGWALSPGQLALRSGLFRQTTTYVLKRHVQSFQSSATWWQKRKRLTTISVSVMPLGTRARVVDVDEANAVVMSRWLEGKRKK